MNVAIASGKGGTGKTTVATNLARVAADYRAGVAYLDCDVEEPNGHLFLRPVLDHRVPVEILVPKIDEQRCAQCGQCGRICRYSAVVCLGPQVLVYPQLCHACGGCARVCPTEAITEVPREVGRVEAGRADSVHFVQGLLKVGEVMAPTVIRAVKQATPPAELVIVDAPPGTSCPVIETVRDADFVVLVTEPTPFGLHDLKLAVETMRQLGRLFGVVLNRADAGDGRVIDYCRAADVPVLLQIPDDRRIAVAYSEGQLAIDAVPELRQSFRRLDETVESMVNGRGAGSTNQPLSRKVGG